MRIEINLENAEDSKEENVISEDNVIGSLSYREQVLTVVIEDVDYLTPAYIAEVSKGVSTVQRRLHKEWEDEETI